MHRSRHLWFGPLVVAALGCGSPGAADLALPAAPRLVGTSVDDGAPVRPTDGIALTFDQALDVASVDGTSILIVRGEVDGDLRSKIERGAIPDDQRDLFAPLRLGIDGDGSTVRAAPLRPLEGETLHSLVVTSGVRAGGLKLAATEVRTFQTLPASSGAPWIELLAPTSGGSDVVPNLRAIDLRFSRAVHGVDESTLRIVDEAGESIAAAVQPGDEVGAFRLSLEAPLRALRSYRIDASDDIRDDEDQPPFAIDPPPSFVAGSTVRDAAPVVSMLDLEASSGCLVARFHVTPAADGALCVDGDCVSQPDLQADRELVHPLAFGASAAVTITARDESTAPAASLGPLPAPATSSRTLVLTEVLSRPKGPHYAQQFVEVQNVGMAPVALGGLHLSGPKGHDVLPAVTLPPGARALIVPDGFSDDDGLDPRPVEGTPIARVSASRLVGNGVPAGGAALWLVEPDGRPVSRFSTVGLKLAMGQSARRADPCDRAGAWEPTPSGSTPGGP